MHAILGGVGGIAVSDIAATMATMIRLFGDWDLAEDCAAEAFATAVRRWESGYYLLAATRGDLLRRLGRRDEAAAACAEAMARALPMWRENFSANVSSKCPYDVCGVRRGDVPTLRMDTETKWVTQDVRDLIADQRGDLASTLGDLPEEAWDAPTLPSSADEMPVRFFGVDLDGIELRATDVDWTLGTGVPLTGAAQDLLLVLCGRKLPPGHLDGKPSTRFTAA